MADKLKLLLEAEKRGLLSGANAAMLAEARKRGLVGSEPAQAAPAPSGEPVSVFGSDEDRARGREWMQRAAGEGRIEDRTDKKSTARGVLDAVANGVSFGARDELRAGVRAVFDGTDDESFGEEYNRFLGEEQGASRQFANDHPYISGGAEIAGALGGGVGLAKQGLTLAKNGVGVGQATARGAAEGAIYGGLHGAGNADQGQRMEGGGDGAKMGALLGGAVSGGLTAGGRMLARPAEKIPSAQALKQEADDFYAKANAANPVFDAGRYAQFTDDLQKTMADEALDIDAPGAVRAVTRALRDRGQNVTFKNMEGIRKAAGRAAGNFNNQGEQRLGMILKNKVDDFVSTDPVFDDVAKGREAYQRYRKAEQIADAMKRAEHRAGSTGSGGNVNNAMRQEIRKILDSKKLSAGYSADELAQMERIVMGSKGENAARLTGKLAPGGNGLTTTLTLGAATVNPVAAMGSAAVGTGSKVVADALTKRNIRGLEKMIRAGGQLPEAIPLIEQQKIQAISRALASQQGSFAPTQ